MARFLSCQLPLRRTSTIHSATSENTAHSNTASHHGSTVPYGIAVTTIRASRQKKTIRLVNLVNHGASLDIRPQSRVITRDVYSVIPLLRGSACLEWSQ